jgi:ribosomal-protein-alanine N-acetyltransferase
MSAVLKSGFPLIIPMTADDLSAVLAIENDIYEFPWTRGNFRDSLESGYSCWLYRDGADLVGYAVVMLALDEAHLLNLSIARATQRRGYGRQLLEEVSAVARGHGARSMFLEVRPTNLAGRELYARSGFRQVGLRRSYYPAHGGREDALVLSRTL